MRSAGAALLVVWGSACRATAAAPAAGAPAASARTGVEETVVIVADTPGDGAHPAHVRLTIALGNLRVRGGGRNVVGGTVRSSTKALEPEVLAGPDGISVTQRESVDVVGSSDFALTLGATPVRLEVETGRAESQLVDLGGVSLASARLFTANGHLRLDWSTPNTIAAETIELGTRTGIVEATHLGISGGSLVRATTDSGMVVLDLGDRVERDVVLEVRAGNGKVRIVVPKAVPSRARLEHGGAGGVAITGWARSSEGFILGDPATTPRVSITGRAEAGTLELVAGP